MRQRNEWKESEKREQKPSLFSLTRTGNDDDDAQKLLQKAKRLKSRKGNLLKRNKGESNRQK